MAGKKQYSAKEMRQAIRDADGVIRVAASRLGCAPSTIYRYADDLSTVQDTIEETRKDTYAEAQGYLVAMMRDREHKDHKWAIERVLKTYGEQIPDGLEWSDKERREITGRDGDAVKHSLTWYDADDAED